jgi:hypothetical protein
LVIGKEREQGTGNREQELRDALTWRKKDRKFSHLPISPLGLMRPRKQSSPPKDEELKI